MPAPPCLLWARVPAFRVTQLEVGFIRGRNSERRERVVAGDSDGVVHVLALETGEEIEEDKLEIRRGSITALLLTPQHILAGDSAGSVVVYTGCQMVYKLDMGSPVTKLATTIDRASNKLFVAGDASGGITGFRGHDIHWRVSLRDLAHGGEESMCSVRSLASNASCGQAEGSLKLAVSDTRGVLHIFVGKHLQTSIHSPCIMNSIWYIPPHTDGGNTSDTFLMAGEDGLLYHLEANKIVRIGMIGCAVSQACALGANESWGILSAGDFDGLKILREGKVISVTLGEWVHCFHDGAVNIVACTMENRLVLLNARSLCEVEENHKL